MKIIRLTTYRVPPRWVFLKIDTDESITRWGEPVIGGRARTVEAAVQELSEYLVRRDPRRINDLSQVMYRGGFYRGGPILMSALAGIDQALWDILCKSMQRPVYELLGGRLRHRMNTYCWVGGDRPCEVVEGIQRARAMGFDTFKMNGTEEFAMVESHAAVDRALENFALIRSEFGGSVDFGIDFHGRVSMPMAKVLLRELEPLRPLFVEEPVVAENCEYYFRLADHTSIPLAAGERMGCIRGPISSASSRPAASPSSSRTCPTQVRSASACASRRWQRRTMWHSRRIAHSAPSPLAACLQVDLVSQNAVFQEQSMGIHYNKGAELLGYVLNPEDFRVADGFLTASEQPGLGVQIDEERVAAASRGAPDWRNPVSRHRDGSIAEW